jgi:hypothetical protein
VVVEGVKGVKSAPCHPECMKMEKTGGFMHFFAYKSLKTPFFAQKYLTRYIPKTFFEEYINLKFYVHCGIVELYPFKFRKSYMPQPPVLGLKGDTLANIVYFVHNVKNDVLTYILTIYCQHSCRGATPLPLPLPLGFTAISDHLRQEKSQRPVVCGLPTC